MPQRSVRGEPFDKLRAGLSNPAVSLVELHERSDTTSWTLRQLRVNGFSLEFDDPSISFV
ncbi:MAG: hypothetical protein CV081_02875 [Nitrospira sp. LK265]|nr:hypothetical protein [Nitrospira sp. LK265]